MQILSRSGIHGLVIVLIFVWLMSIGTKVGQESLGLVISGVYRLIFWGYFLALGLLAPLAVFTYQVLRTKKTVGQVANEPEAGIKESAMALQKGHHSYFDYY